MKAESNRASTEMLRRRREANLLNPVETEALLKQNQAVREEAHEWAGGGTENLTKHFVRFREQPLSFIQEIGLTIKGAQWRGYNQPIGSRPIYYRGFTENMSAAVLASPILLARIRELADARLGQETWLEGEAKEARREQIELWLEQVASQEINRMICKFEHKRFIRVSISHVMLMSGNLLSD